MLTVDAHRTHTARRHTLGMQDCCLEDCDMRRDDFGIGGITISAGSAELLIEHIVIDSDRLSMQLQEFSSFSLLAV